jgi:hypothetical protein
VTYFARNDRLGLTIKYEYLWFDSGGLRQRLLSTSPRVGLEPDIGQQLARAVNRLSREPGEDVLKIGERVWNARR